MSKIVNNNGQYKITLPKDLILDKGWKPGQRIRFVEDHEGNITLKPVEEKVVKKKSHSSRFAHSNKKNHNKHQNK